MQCGNGLSSPCSQCGAHLPREAVYCPSCGTHVAIAGRAPAKPTSQDPRTPKHLAEKILAAKSAVEGERKQVTILFADLKSSMEILAEQDAEIADKLLDSVLELMMDAVHRYEGIVNQVMGDGIMALFGVPLTHEDHAIRACYSALGMQESVKRLAPNVLKTHGVSLSIRVGINSGEVVVRTVGNELHTDYTAVGQSTHLAARLEKLAPAGSVMIASNTFRMAEGYITVKSHGRAPIKGLPEPVEIFELTGVTPARSRLHASAIRGLTPFVGRQGKLAELQNALEKVSLGHGQVFAIIGEAGVGKSRLLWEFLKSRNTRGCTTLGSASHSYDKATTYFPIIDLLKGYFQIETHDEPRLIREKITNKVLALDPSLETTLPALLSLFDAAPQTSHWEQLDAMHRRRRILESVKHVLLRESITQPVILLFEDLHNIDSETQALLDGLIDSLAAARVLLLVSYRPEYRHNWSSKKFYEKSHVEPLDKGSARELLSALLGSDASLDSLKNQLMDAAEGSPLYIEESVRILIDTEAITGVRGDYRRKSHGTTIQIPPTIQAILAARMDRLPPEDKHLLQSAAVIGRDVQLSLLEAIAGQHGENLHTSIARLIAGGYLLELRLFPETEYTFAHESTRKAAHQSLLRERRAALHARAAKAISEREAHRADDVSHLIAPHLREAGQYAEAAAQWLAAAKRDAARYANIEAMEHCKNGLTALKQLPRSERLTSAQTKIELRIAMADRLRILNRYHLALRQLRGAEAASRKYKQESNLFQIHHLRGNIYYPMGNTSACMSEHTAAWREARKTPSAETEARAYGGLGDAHFLAGNIALAHEHFEKCVTLARDNGLRLAEIAYLPMRAVTHMYSNRDAASLEDCRSAIDLAAQLGQARGELIARNTCSWILLDQKSHEQAEEHARKGIEAAERMGARSFLPLFNDVLARLCLLANDRAGALELLRESWQVSRALGKSFVGPVVLGGIALAADDSTLRDSALRLGKKILLRGCPSHNHFRFYRDAIAVSLRDGHWDNADTYATELYRYCNSGPPPWAKYFVDRGRELADAGRHGVMTSMPQLLTPQRRG